MKRFRIGGMEHNFNALECLETASEMHDYETLDFVVDDMKVDDIELIIVQGEYVTVRRVM